MYANMTSKQMQDLADTARSCWEYAKTVGSVHNPKFKQWFENRARQLHRLDDAQIAQAWAAAIKMYS